MTARSEQHRKEHYIIYKSLFEIPRIQVKDIASLLHIDRNTASRRMNEAFVKGYIAGPQIRKRSFANLMEYVYFVKCDDPIESYMQYREDKNVVFHAIMDGFADLWITANKELKIEGEIIAGGPRSDYYGALTPNHSWDTTKKVMKRRVENFSPKDYEHKGFITTHWNETAEWDAEFKLLYQEFKFNLRKKQTPIRKKYPISGSKMQKWFNKLPEYCTIATSYFPETFSAYNPYFIMMETDYEDFIIELFSELPTSSYFFRVSNKLFLYTFVNREFLLGNTSFHSPELNQLFLRLLVRDLLKREIIKSESHSRLEFYFEKDL